MRALRLEWKREPPPGPIDASVFDPVALGVLGDAELFATKVTIGAREHSIGDLFDVRSIDRAIGPCVVIDGSERFWRLGAGLEGGSIDVRGPAGDYAGCAMRSGELAISGDAGDFLGAEMRGGSILVVGSAGDRVGAPLAGSTRGMTGGEIVIAGDAGALAGHRMRRGLIAVHGRAGALPGFAMIAGTIVVGEGALDRPGAAMTRGTIIALDPATVPPTGFVRDGPSRPTFWRILASEVYDSEIIAARDDERDSWYESILGAEFIAWSGDALRGSRGEILVRRS